MAFDPEGGYDAPPEADSSGNQEAGGLRTGVHRSPNSVKKKPHGFELKQGFDLKPRVAWNQARASRDASSLIRGEGGFCLRFQSHT